jgi:hypothetical protein
MTKMLSAKEMLAKIADSEGAKASAALKAQAAAEAEKHAMMERLSKPSGLTDDELLEKASIIIGRAVENGMTSVQVLRFPHTLCNDSGRAINQAEEGWENSLTGIPRELFEFWKRQLHPRGYHIRYEILSYPGGMLGDVGVTISWG